MHEVGKLEKRGKICSIVTIIGGGLLRDMMAGVPPYIFVRHIYACASIVGALTCVWIYRIFGEVEAMMVSSAIVLFIRYLAAHYRLDLPRLELKEFRDHENRL